MILTFSVMIILIWVTKFDCIHFFLLYIKHHLGSDAISPWIEFISFQVFFVYRGTNNINWEIVWVLNQMIIYRLFCYTFLWICNTVYVFFVKFNIDYNICNQISNDEEFLSDNLNGVLTQSHAFLLALQKFTLFGIPYIFFYPK